MPVQNRSVYAASRKARGLSGGTRRAVEKAEIDHRIEAACLRDTNGKLVGIDAAMADRLWDLNTDPLAAARSGGLLKQERSYKPEGWKPDRSTLDVIEEAFATGLIPFAALVHAGTGLSPLECAQTFVAAMACVGDALEKKYGLAYDLYTVHGDLRFIYLQSDDLNLELLVQQIEMAAESMASHDVDIFYDQNWSPNRVGRSRPHDFLRESRGIIILSLFSSHSE